MKRLQFFVFAFLLCASMLKAQVYTNKDKEICSSKFKLAANAELAKQPINDVIAQIGKSFLGTDYAASALEADGDEQLVINLTGLDCTTFLENTLVFSRLIKAGKSSFEDYLHELENVRYRDGKLKGYTSRLHYFSDWIHNNIKKGILEDITKSAGGEKLKFNINFMSTHPASYKQLKNNPDFINTIGQQEQAINEREYFYIPKEKVPQFENFIKNGDLIAITTNIKGLDISHVGIAVKEKDGRIHLLHAPTVGSKVQVTDAPLSEYLMKVKKHSGIIILRASEPVL
jgi:hypothetical protein